MLTVSSHVHSDQIQVQLHGRLDGSPSCTALSDEVKAMLEYGHRRFVIDLSGVEWMSSCGIGCLIAAYSSVRRKGGSLILTGPNERVLSALRITELVPTVFEVIDPLPARRTAEY